jgi:hypothetical protein
LYSILFYQSIWNSLPYFFSWRSLETRFSFSQFYNDSGLVDNWLSAWIFFRRFLKFKPITRWIRSLSLLD